MSDVLTLDQIAAVRAIAAEMIGEALRGADQRIAGALAREAPTPASDEQIRFECLKIAALSSGNDDPRPASEVLFRYVKQGLRTERRHPDQASNSAEATPSQSASA